MIKTVRYIAIVLLFLTGINALVAGALFIIDPSGGKMGMTTAYLEHSPFRSFLIPGIILFLVNGLMNIAAGIITLRNGKRSSLLIMLQGILLGGWILVQVWMVRDINPLHITMFSIGLALFLSGSWLRKKSPAF